MDSILHWNGYQGIQKVFGLGCRSVQSSPLQGYWRGLASAFAQYWELCWYVLTNQDFLFTSQTDFIWEGFGGVQGAIQDDSSEIQGDLWWASSCWNLGEDGQRLLFWFSMQCKMQMLPGLPKDRKGERKMIESSQIMTFLKKTLLFYFFFEISLEV